MCMNPDLGDKLNNFGSFVNRNGYFINMLQEGEDRLQLDRVLKIANPIHLEELVNCTGHPFISKPHFVMV